MTEALKRVSDDVAPLLPQLRGDVDVALPKLMDDVAAVLPQLSARTPSPSSRS
jgi:hypothetical protein